MHFPGIEAEADPAARADVRGHVEPLGLGLDEGGIVAGVDLAVQGDDAVAMMIIHEIREYFVTRTEGGMGAVPFARGVGELEADFGKFFQKWVGDGGRWTWHVSPFYRIDIRLR